MPAWLMFLIQMALRLGLPWLENHVPPAIAKMIEDILKLIGGASNQTAMVAKLHDAVRSCGNVECPADLVKE